MTTLSDAESALHQAQSDHSAATAAASIAQSHAASLREQLASGHGEHIGPDDLAVAAQRAEHASLVVAGTVAALVGLDEAVRDATANELADEVVLAVPQAGTRLLDSLDKVAAALADYREAARAFDSCVTSATHQLDTVGSASPRYHAPRHGHRAVDGVSLARCSGDRALACVVGPVLAALGAPRFATSELSALAQARPNIPTTN
jgi:hypothetical protein